MCGGADQEQQSDRDRGLEMRDRVKLAVELGVEIQKEEIDISPGRDHRLGI